MTNERIKRILKQYGIKQWQLAEAIGTNEYALSKKMRHELDNETVEEYTKVIKALALNNIQGLLGGTR